MYYIRPVTITLTFWVALCGWINCLAAEYSVDADGLRLRSGPSTEAAHLTILPRGYEVVKIDEQNGKKYHWFQVEADAGVKGWVAAQFLSPVKRKGPSSPLEAAVAKQTAVEVLGDKDRSAKIDDFVPDPTLQPELRTIVVSIPAPRGRILDRDGDVLVTNRVADQLMYSPDHEGPVQSKDEFLARVLATIQHLRPALSDYLDEPPQEEILSHYTHRRPLPIPLSRIGVPQEKVSELEKLNIPGLSLRKAYLRHYPGGNSAAHLLGYVGKAGSPLSGPVREREPLWRPTTGRSGLELIFNDELSGTPGLVVLGYNESGDEIARDVLENAIPGSDIVLTLDSEIQRAVESALESKGRPGSAVVIDPTSGDLLAMASSPSFAPAEFASGITSAKFNELQSDEDDPMFPRAHSASYPPGSIFKPFVALAGLETGGFHGFQTYDCHPVHTIAGREFRNWSDTDSGLFNVRGALVRSHNGFFYQAAQDTGGAQILSVARQFRFGEEPSFPLSGTATGALPDRTPGPQSLANLSIGQGDVLISPLQAAVAMGALCVEDHIRPPRLISHIQTPAGIVTDMNDSQPSWRLYFAETSLAYVKGGMYGVVNHEKGTGKAARLPNVAVYGKTGTAQWQNGGEASVAWFAGFVPTSTPPIAFVVCLEGKPGERIFGGSTAAPVAGTFLRKLYSDPERFDLSVPPRTTPFPVQKYELSFPDIETYAASDPTRTISSSPADYRDSPESVHIGRPPKPRQALSLRDRQLLKLRRLGLR